MSDLHCDLNGHLDSTSHGTDGHVQVDCHHPNGSGWSGSGHVSGNHQTGNHYDLGLQHHFNDHFSVGGGVGWGGTAGNNVSVGGSFHW